MDEHPIFTSRPNASIPENTTFVIVVEAFDPERLPIIYSVEDSTPDAKFFTIDQKSGVLSLKHPIDFEVGPLSFNIDISAFDGRLSTIQNFDLNITDVNEIPSITSRLYVEYAESQTGPITTVKNWF